MPKNFGPLTLKVKKGDIVCKVQKGTNALCWKDKTEVQVVTNTHTHTPQHRVILWAKNEMHQNFCVLDL
jgi:hypothetical protein